MRPLQSVLSLAASAPNITHLFGPSLSPGAAIYLASDANYTDETTQRWTSHAAPAYVATIQPATIADVQNVVKIAVANNLPFLATGGGHGVSVQMGGLHGGVQVDLARFDSVEFDAAQGLLTIGGSVRFSELIDVVYEAGYQFPIGTAGCVGVVGATLGAGISASQGYFGLLIDLLEEVLLVTARGHLVAASRAQNPDLFWALRGAGANFGIVVSAVYRVPRAVNSGSLTNANFLFPVANASAVYEYLASWDRDMPGEMALNIGTFYNKANDELALLINANFAGPRDMAEPLLAPLQRIGPLRSEVLDVAWPDVFATSYFGIPDTKACGRNQNVNMRSVGARQTDPQATVEFLDQLAQFSRRHPEVETAMMIHRFPVPKAPAADAGVYPHRDVTMHIQLESVYEDRQHDSAVDDFLQAARQRFTEASGFDHPVVYVNFAHGDEEPSAWYGRDNLKRLGHVKREWDPRQVFSFFNAIRIGDSES